MKIAIATDINSGITPAEAEQEGLFLMQTPIIIDGEQYYQDVNLTQDEFYTALRGGSRVSTAQPSIYSVGEFWREILKEYDYIIHAPLSSSLSEAYYQMKKLAEMEFGGKVFVIDNKRVSITLRQSVLDAKKMADEGKAPEEIAEWLEQTKVQASIYLTVPTLEYLKRSGRLSATTAFFGSLMNIKPILQIQGEKIEQFKKVRKMSDAKAAMIQAVKNDLYDKFKEQTMQGKMGIGIAHTDNLAAAEKFKEEVLPQFPDVPFVKLDALNLSVAAHIGPGVLAFGCTRLY